jgi:hypothetical protein
VTSASTARQPAHNNCCDSLPTSWTPLLHTKTEESLCAHIGGDLLNIGQCGEKVTSRPNTLTADTTHTCTSRIKHTYFTSSTHTFHPIYKTSPPIHKTSHPIHILHTKYTYFIPNRHSSQPIHVLHTKNTQFIPSRHSSHPIHILHTKYTYFIRNRHSSHPTHTLHTQYIFL